MWAISCGKQHCLETENLDHVWLTTRWSGGPFLLCLLASGSFCYYSPSALHFDLFSFLPLHPCPSSAPISLSPRCFHRAAQKNLQVISHSAPVGDYPYPLHAYVGGLHAPEGYVSVGLMNHHWWWLGNIYDVWLSTWCWLIELGARGCQVQRMTKSNCRGSGVTNADAFTPSSYDQIAFQVG